MGISLHLSGRGNSIVQHIAELLFQFSLGKHGNREKNVLQPLDIQTLFNGLPILNHQIGGIQLAVIYTLIARLDWCGSFHFLYHPAIVFENKGVKRNSKILGYLHDLIKIGGSYTAFPFLNRLLRHAENFRKLRLR